MNKKDFWSEENKVKPDWGPYRAPIKHECQSCFKWFETTDRWAQRCPKCKKANSPKRKKIYNDKRDLNINPF